MLKYGVFNYLYGKVYILAIIVVMPFIFCTDKKTKQKSSSQDARVLPHTSLF